MVTLKSSTSIPALEKMLSLRALVFLWVRDTLLANPYEQGERIHKKTGLKKSFV